MENWNKRSKRWQASHLNAVCSLYGDKVSPPAPTYPQTPKVPVKRKSGRSRVEQGMQIQLVGWIRDQGLPVMSIPNEGKRSPWLTEILKACGLWSGASDLFLAVMRGGFGGFFIELKKPGEKPRANQWDFIHKMRARGYMAEYYDNLEDAKAAITLYLSSGV